MDTIPSFSHTPCSEEDKRKQDDDSEGMDQMFEGQGPYSEEFSVDNFTHGSGSSVWKPGYIDDTECHTREYSDHIRVRNHDLKDHRRDSFPHTRHLLKPGRHHHHHHHHHRKGHGHKKLHKNDIEDEKDDEIADGDKLQDEKLGSPSLSIEIDDPDLQEGCSKNSISESVPEVLPPSQDHPSEISHRHRLASTDEELLETSPLISPRITSLRPCIRSETDTAGSEDEIAASKRGRVQFDIGGSDAAESEQEQKSKIPRKRKTHRRKHCCEDPNLRLRSGNEKRKPDHHGYMTTSVEEARQLREQELNQISTHRFEEKAVPRRQTLRAKSSLSSFFHPTHKAESPSKPKEKIEIIRKTFDHNPHEVFVELAELKQSPMGGLEWKETARWIKYEEDVEGADSRWGKPHIAFLNFNALFSLRKGLERGAILLDLDEQDLTSVATRVVDHMVTCDQIPYDQRDAVIRIILLRHKHIKETQNAFRRASRIASRSSRLHLAGGSDDKLAQSHSMASLAGRPSTVRSFANLFHANTTTNFNNPLNSIDDSSLSNNKEKPSSRRASCSIEVESDSETKERRKLNLDLLKKLPEGAEATAVLVGAVDFLNQPTIAFVRLAEGIVMENVIEVPIPVRFLFVLLGPYNGEMDYHEVGRAISTLMSDKCFHEVAYKAHSRGQLLAAINEFLNASIVFPPSEWKHKDLVPIEAIYAKSLEMRRKNEDLKAARRKQGLTSMGIAEAEVNVTQVDSDKAVVGGSEGKPPPRDPLQRKGKLFYGLIQDVKIRYSQYSSDIRDGLSPQVISACIFIFFAALSPSVTFGGIYSDLTDRYIGVSETLLVSSINGAIFALFAAQPLLIVGATGPLMIFDMSLNKFCEEMDIDFLATRVWVGIWILVIGLLVAAFEAVSIVKKFTRFTEEIFSTFVCIIFIYGAFEKLATIYQMHPLTSLSFYVSTSDLLMPCLPSLNITNVNLTDRNEDYEEALEELKEEEEDDFHLLGLIDHKTVYLNISGGEAEGNEDTVDGVLLYNQPNTALMSTFLMIGTFLIAWKLKKFRNSKFLGRTARRALGDFGVPLAIFLMVLLDFLIKETYTDKLSMPKGLKPSNADVRGWFINPLGVVSSLPVWVMLAAAPASLLLFVLIFIEENICHLILAKPERCLKKGSGFHLDLVLSCFINTVSGFLGAPFMGPACVRTIAHMSSLTVMSSNLAPGESPQIVGCIEQRVSALTVSVLVGLSVMLYSVLTLVPTPVLLGIFLYMGVSATAGIQYLERFILFFKPVKHHPNVPYVKNVRTRKMHAFTLVQTLMLIILWMVKQSPAALAIPFVLLCLIPVRLYILPFLFTHTELISLDGKEQATLVEAHEDERDFYEAAHDLGTQIEEKDHIS